MSNMAKYTRIFEMAPTDEYVGKRSRAVITICDWLKGLTPSCAVEVASSIADALVTDTLSEDIAHVVENAISSESDSFVRENQELQMLVCSMLAAMELIRHSPASGGWSAVDALAAGLWSSLSFQRPVGNTALEGLRSDLLQASRKRVMIVADASRERVEVPEIGKLTIPEDSPPASRTNTAFRNAIKPLVAALRSNAELDREEIDFLWWVLAERSDKLDMSLSDLEGASRAIVAGIDGSEKLRKLPTGGHRHVVLRSVKSGENLSLSDVVEQLDAHRKNLTQSYVLPSINKASAVFPLLLALATGEVNIHGEDVKRSPFDWGARALLEGSIWQMNAMFQKYPGYLE